MSPHYCLIRRQLTTALAAVSSDGIEDNSYEDESGLANKFYESSAVNEVLSELMTTLSKLDANSDVSINDGLSVDSLQSKFNKLFQDVRDSSSMSDLEKRLVFTEASLLVEDRRRDADPSSSSSPMDAQSDFSGFQFMNAKTSLYTPACAPVVIAYGPGRVGQKVCAIAREYGKAADFRLVDAQRLVSMQEPDLKYAMRDVKSIIIAADAVVVEKRNWFGAVEVETQAPVINSKGLKRLLNAAVAEASKSSRDVPIKVVALGTACKPPKSVASMLFGTEEDNTALEDEVVLQCLQRGLSYNIIKVGRVIDDDQSIPPDVKSRSIESQSIVLTNEDKPNAQPLYQNPVVFTRSNTVESSEVTKLTIAAQALMRAVVHPHRNATVSVLSAATIEDDNHASSSSSSSSFREPMEVEWADEFLKLDGPELLRIPLRFASIRQAMVKLTRVLYELATPSKVGRSSSISSSISSSSTGLVTPIKVEKCTGGLRVMFVPTISEYVSTREEKAELKRIEEVKQLLSTQGNPKRKGGYLSPEEEASIAQQGSLTKGATVVPPKKKAAAVSLEGGLEIIVENIPYARVRVRRCNMGPKTIVKEESEAFLLKTIRSGVLALDNDYRILLQMDKDKLWVTPQM
jgi:hypothetical protein